MTVCLHYVYYIILICSTFLCLRWYRWSSSWSISTNMKLGVQLCEVFEKPVLKRKNIFSWEKNHVFVSTRTGRIVHLSKELLLVHFFLLSIYEFKKSASNFCFQLWSHSAHLIVFVQNICRIWTNASSECIESVHWNEAFIHFHRLTKNIGHLLV